ncbi:sugar phosphate nucleotidyltransferase [Candidatus Pelagibacter sp.]|nr:sugar phosphate nucleotidyltransferase [Candidatus Pelagibacter sp.]
MIKKAIILCGGTGSRMFPVTKAVNKQLLPVFDKPMFYYPLSLMMLSGIKEYIFVINRYQEKNFKNAIGNTDDLGIKINYIIQSEPRGLPEAFILSEKLIKNESIAMVLGDNFFYGNMLSPIIKNSFKKDKGCNIYLYPSNNTSAYGVVEFDSKNKIKRIIEKPKKTNSNLVITGLYVFDRKVSDYAKNLKPSKRGEIEIVDLINIYKKKNKLNVIKLGRGSAWMDVGNFDDLHSANNFIQNIEDRQSFKIGCLEEIALNNKWINKKNIMNRLKFNKNSYYSNYLKKLIHK